MPLNLMDVNAVIRSWGRGVVFYGTRWDPTTPLVLTHLADTEGDIVINTNGDIQTLTVPELTGPAGHEADFTGENPVAEIPMYLTDPDLLAVVSPSGSKHGGRSRRYTPREYTLVFFPEALFLEVDVNGIIVRREVDWAGGVWTFNDIALDPARTTLLGTSIWLWRGFFNRPPRRFLGGAGDARKNIETASFQTLHHPDMPEGHHLYTQGDPFESAINLEGSS